MEVNAHYLPEEEYQKLDTIMNITNDQNKYSAIAAIYETGVIIYTTLDTMPDEDSKTERVFPNLFKLIKIARREDCNYIDLYEGGSTLDDDTVRRNDLMMHQWSGATTI